MRNLKEVLEKYKKAIKGYEKARDSLIRELAKVDEMKRNKALKTLDRKRR